MTPTPLVVARFKGGDPSQPRFTRSSTVDELMVEINKAIPVDEVYFIVPHEDGKGFSLRLVGKVVLDVHSGPSPEASTTVPFSPSLPQTTEPHKGPQEPLESHEEILSTPEVQPDPKPAFKAKPKAKKAKSRLAADPESTAGIVSQGQIKVTGFTPATPEQAEASSKVHPNFALMSDS